MTRNMLIDAAHPEEVRVCVLENGRVEDFDFEFSSRKPLRGNIYLARITRVEPSLQAAFVEYGGNRHGFLAFNEIHPDYYQIPVSDRRLLQDAEAEEAALAAELGLDSREDDSDLDGDDHDGDDHDGGDDEDGADFRDAERTVAAREEDGEAHDEDDASDETDNGDEHSQSRSDGRGDHESAPDHHADDNGAQSDADDERDDAGREEDEDAGDDGEVDSGDDHEHDSDSATDRAAAFDAEPAESISAPASDSASDEEAAPSPSGDAQAPVRNKPQNQRRSALLERYRDARRKRQRLLRNYKIQEVIKRRQIILVQVVKEERGTKGAALTTYMSLAGRYCVLMPNTARGGGISRKIGVAADRKRLRRVVDELAVPAGMGLIIRTAGAKRTKTEVKRDYDYLTRLWENIRTLTLQSIAPCLIYEEANLIKRAIRDLYDKDIDDITVEGDEGYREAKDFMKMLMPSHAKNVRQHRDASPLFLANDVESQLDAMYQPTVRLKSGGYLVIHQTEALVAIDVNSGKATRERNIEQTALKTNLEAAKEAARQCRLRDLAGLIVIDFIDMEEQRNNRAVEKRFKDALKDDRARIQVGRISNFGLLEMSRQRRRSGIVDGTTHVCPTCSGAGNVRSDEMAALRILRGIETSALKERSATIAVRAALDVTLYILNHKRAWLKRIEDTYAVSVEIVADSSKAGDNFELERRGPARELPQAPKVVRADQTEAIEVEAPHFDGPEEADEVDGADDEAGERREGRRHGGHAAEGRGENGQRQDGQRQDGEGGRRRRRRRRRGRREDGLAPRENGAHGPGDDDASDDAANERMRASPETERDDSDAGDDSDGPEETRTEHAQGEDGEGRRRRRRGRRGGRRNRGRNEGGGEPREPGSVEQAAAGSESEQPTLTHWPEAPEPVAAERTPLWSAEPQEERPIPRWDEPVTPEARREPAPAAVEQAIAEQTGAEPEAPREPRPARKGWWSRALGG